MRLPWGLTRGLRGRGGEGVTTTGYSIATSHDPQPLPSRLRACPLPAKLKVTKPRQAGVWLGRGAHRVGGAAAIPVVDDAQPRRRRLVIRRGSRHRFRRCLPFRDRGIKQEAARSQPLELALLEQANDAVFAVVAGIADHLPGAQPRDRLGEQRRAGMRDVLDRHRLQDRELGPELGDRLIVAALDRARRRTAHGELGEDFRQRHQVRHAAGGRRRFRLLLAAVGEHLDAVLDADGQGLAADRWAIVSFGSSRTAHLRWPSR